MSRSRLNLCSLKKMPPSGMPEKNLLCLLARICKNNFCITHIKECSKTANLLTNALHFTHNHHNEDAHKQRWFFVHCPGVHYAHISHTFKSPKQYVMLWGTHTLASSHLHKSGFQKEGSSLQDMLALVDLNAPKISDAHLAPRGQKTVCWPAAAWWSWERAPYATERRRRCSVI